MIICTFDFKKSSCSLQASYNYVTHNWSLLSESESDEVLAIDTSSPSTTCTVTTVSSLSVTTVSTSLPCTSSTTTTVTETQSTSSLHQSSSLPADIAKDKVDKPVQPQGITFPSRMFSSTKRSFQSTWYTLYPWIEYSVQRDSVYCFPCRFFRVNPDSILTVTGFSGPMNATLLGHDYQNSMLSVLAQSVLEYIIDEVRVAQYYTIIVDETKDMSKKEQLTLILRYVLNGVVHERFVSYTYCEELHAAAITSYIYDALSKIGLNIADCVSQCYDGASVMSGSLTL